MKKDNQKNGFTLVELIVVLVILAILASLLVPSLTRYIERAKKQAVIAEAKDVWTASQAALSECYALYPESFNAPSAGNQGNNCRFTVTVNGQKIQNVGKISNGALGALQKNPNDTVEADTASRKVSAIVLKYLESADKTNPRYTFGSGNTVNGKTRPSTYFSGKPKATDVIIQIFHTSDGKVVALNFGKNGYMVTIVPGQDITCEYDGNCLSSTG